MAKSSLNGELEEKEQLLCHTVCINIYIYNMFIIYYILLYVYNTYET